MWVKCAYCSKRYSLEEDDREQMKVFPFCCRRCKLLDLGDWLDGKYRLADEAQGSRKEKHDD